MKKGISKFKLLIPIFMIVIAIGVYFGVKMRELNTISKSLEKNISSSSYLINMEENSEQNKIINIVGETSIIKIKELIKILPNIKKNENYIIYFSKKPYKITNLFFDENLIAKVTLDKNKLIEYFTETTIEPSLEVKNTFEVTKIEENNNIINITIKINGDTPSNIIGNAKRIVAAITDLNNIDTTKEVITYIDTESSDYIIDSLDNNLIKFIENIDN